MVVFKDTSTTIFTTEGDRSPQDSLPIQLPGISSWDFAYPGGRCSLPVTTGMNCHFSKNFIYKTIPQENHALQSSTSHLSPSHHWQKEARKSRKHSPNNSNQPELKTYLLSSLTFPSLMDPQTHDTISNLLQTPNMKLIYLVPQANIVCPKACELMRLTRAVGSSIQVLPVEPSIGMRYCGRGEWMKDDAGRKCVGDGMR